jgi:hypothetical protein
MPGSEGNQLDGHNNTPISTINPPLTPSVHFMPQLKRWWWIILQNKKGLSSGREKE